MNGGYFLNRSQQLQLIWLVIKEEVFEALQSIDSIKSPGLDRFNAFFFKKTWNFIRDEVLKLCLIFFHTGQMLQAVNCTSATIKPKVKQPITVKDFRPISCCSVLYKIISKTPTNILQRVMDPLVDQCQLVFVLRRVIIDSSILGHELVSWLEDLWNYGMAFSWVGSTFPQYSLLYLYKGL